MSVNCKVDIDHEKDNAYPVIQILLRHLGMQTTGHQSRLRKRDIHVRFTLLISVRAAVPRALQAGSCGRTDFILLLA